MALRLPPDLIDRIRDSTDIVDLISGYVQLERKGGNWFGLCPFHGEKTGSFSVHPGKGIFHCFGCGVGGNVFTFLQLHDKLSFTEAARELARRAGIPLPEEAVAGERVEGAYDALYAANEYAAQWFSQHLMKSKGPEFDAVREYLKGRKVTAGLAKTFRLGYSPDRWDGLTTQARKLPKNGLGLPHGGATLRDFIQAGLVISKEGREYDRFRGRLMFPVLNLSGRVVAFGGRTLKADEEGAKYVNSPETPIYHKGGVLYGLHQAREQIRRRGECLVVEGYMDLMRLVEGGFAHAVASSGTALTSEQASILRRLCRQVVLIFDGDAAGSHATVRGGDVLLAAGLEVRVVGLPSGHDPDSFIRDNGPGAFGELLDKAQDAFTYRIELYRKQGRLTEAPQRTAVARELLDSLMAVPDPIRQELAAQEAARGIGLSVETMLRELAVRRAKARRKPDKDVQPPVVENPYTGMPLGQKSLIEALIRWPELRNPVFAQITALEFQEGALLRIASRLEESCMSGDEIQSEELIGDGTPIEDAAFISQALAQTEVDATRAAPGLDRKAMWRHNDFKAAHDCLLGLLQERLENEYSSLKAEAGTPDVEKQLSLTRKLRDVHAKRKILRERKFWDIPIDPSLDVSKKLDQIRLKE
jgi:DNA primase